MRILLTEAGVQAIQDPVRGEGELAELLRNLQANLVGNMLMVSREDYAALQRYAATPGGDLEDRARTILEGAQVS
jgi:hypothetical protein